MLLSRQQLQQQPLRARRRADRPEQENNGGVSRIWKPVNRLHFLYCIVITLFVLTAMLTTLWVIHHGARIPTASRLAFTFSPLGRNASAGLPHTANEYCPLQHKIAHADDVRILKTLKIPEAVTVYVATPNFWAPNADKTCSWPKQANNEPVRCIWHEDHTRGKDADVLWYHGPNLNDEFRPDKFKCDQLSVIFSHESVVYYPVLINPALVNQFDLTSNYRLDSDIPAPYFQDVVGPSDDKLPLVPLDKKISAVAYTSSNCASRNGREVIMKNLMKVFEVHSFGKCDNNRKWPDDIAKIPLLNSYKFCVAMENSNSVDYVTEKIYQALKAGCIPIYFGASNIDLYLPVPANEIILDFNKMRSVDELAARLKYLDENDSAYNDMMAWRTLSLDQTLPEYQLLNEYQDDYKCLICKKIALMMAYKQAKR